MRASRIHSVAKGLCLLFSAGSCKDLELANGEISFTYDFDPPLPRRPYGTVAVFSCNDGFELIGSEVIGCVNGTWNETISTCELNCKKFLHSLIYNITKK